MKKIIFLLVFSFSISTLLAQDFYLNSNGVTCMCPAASVGDTGVVNGITYTKRTREQINTPNAATTCTSGIINMGFLFYNHTDHMTIQHLYDASLFSWAFYQNPDSVWCQLSRADHQYSLLSSFHL